MSWWASERNYFQKIINTHNKFTSSYLKGTADCTIYKKFVRVRNFSV